MTIDRFILDEAIRRTLKLNYVFSGDDFINHVWDEYNIQIEKMKRDKKAFNGDKLMEISGVLGFYYHNNEVEVTTKKGLKTYKIGKVKMDTVAKRVERFIKI